MLFVREHAFDATVTAAAAAHGVPAPLILAVIAQESGFDPNVTRAEPQLGDASRGLMQLLAATARGLGFAGDPGALLDPAVNIPLGAKYLAEQFRQTQEWAAAVSAYNGGYRPGIGFGRRAVAPVTVCVRRNTAGECVETRAVPVGQFANQGYVDNVLAYWEHYKTDAPEVVAPDPVATLPPAGSGCLGGLALWVVAAVLGARA